MRSLRDQRGPYSSTDELLAQPVRFTYLVGWQSVVRQQVWWRLSWRSMPPASGSGLLIQTRDFSAYASLVSRLVAERRKRMALVPVKPAPRRSA